MMTPPAVWGMGGVPGVCIGQLCLSRDLAALAIGVVEGALVEGCFSAWPFAELSDGILLSVITFKICAAIDQD